MVWPWLPAWLGSEAVWFIALNVVVAIIAIQSSRARPSQATPRRFSSVLQSLRSFSIFSFPSACLTFLHPDAAAAAYQETETTEMVLSPPTDPSPRALAPPLVPVAVDEDEDEEEGDPNAMSLDEAYALVMASRLRPEREREEETRRSEVDAKEKFMCSSMSMDDLRQQRLNSIFNYTQMLKQRGIAAGRGHPEDTRTDQI